MTLLAALTTERDWPWRDGDILGWPGLLAAAAVLVVLTLWTYSGQRSIGWRKVLSVLGLRLAALVVIVLLMLRPSFASQQTVITPGRLIIIVDNSLSMKISDAPNSSTRWDYARNLLAWPEIKEALNRLQKDKQIDVVFYQGAENLSKFDPAGDADGKRTDIGKWLYTARQWHRNDPNLRGIILLTDGADNGTSHAVLDEAARMRELPCPVHTFGVGNETTKSGQRDIAVVDVKPAREPVYLKSKVLIKATIDAPNMEGQNVTVRLFVDGKQVSVNPNVTLANTRGNVIDAGQFVADRVGEIKVTVKVDEVPGEITALNNEMSTYIQVRKEGLSILWVEGSMRPEATGIYRHALAGNPRFDVTFDQRFKDGPLSKEQAELFKTAEKSFDVLIIGDISASRFSGGDKALLDHIATLVNTKRTGLLMLGGFKTFGNSDWKTVGKSLAAVLPVELAGPEQVEELVRAVPTPANRGHRLLQLNVPVGKDLWGDIFLPLNGYAKLGKVKPGALTLLETEEGKDPLFVVTPDDGPRVAVFAGNTTHIYWRYNEDLTKAAEAVRAFERFWSQLVLWLARQEETDNQVWIKLDKRRISVGANLKLGLTVGAEGKDGQPIRNGTYTVKVQGPGGELYDVATALKDGLQRGAFGQANAVGEYKAIVTATAPGPGGQEISLGTASARFMGFAEDVEIQQPAANHKALTEIAAAGGGEFHIAGKDELLQYLQELADVQTAPGWVKRDLWPNWKATPESKGFGDQLAALFESLALPCLVVFVMCLGMEWYLRRRWGLV